MMPKRTSIVAVTIALSALLCASGRDARGQELLQQTQDQADAASAGCRSCHGAIEPMHRSSLVRLGCTDCHGGDATSTRGDAAPGSEAYDAAKAVAHVSPLHPERWVGSANPVRSYTLLNEESPEFIRFFNPGDLRIAAETCGQCHAEEVVKVRKSLMTTSALLWGGAAYNNGIVGTKNYIFGESYGRDGTPQRLNTVPPPTEEQLARGVVPYLLPLPPWNVVQPADPLRAFERGGKIDRYPVTEIGNPNIGPFLDEPGRPDMKLSSRGLGTELRTSAGILNIHKTRLNDPVLSFLGTNDHAGDFRSSGCTACHVVYANDRDGFASGPYARFGHQGTYAGKDPTIPKDERGHPISHQLTRSIPTSQCIVCHMHQPNSFVNTYLGYQWWDYETDGSLMWPEKQAYPTRGEPVPFQNLDGEGPADAMRRNPEGASPRGKWTDEDFLNRVSELPSKDTKFADYHGHGWIFRAVYKKDRKGMLLDAHGDRIPWDDPDKLDKAVHLRDIHAEKGMHCVDCHFEQDAHGDGLLYGAYPDAVEIGCRDCHGAVDRYASIDAEGGLETSGPASSGQRRFGKTPWDEPRFEWLGGKLIQRSMMKEDLEWEVSQVVDAIDPSSSEYNPRAALAKTIQRDGTSWGAVPDDAEALAHSQNDMFCYTCHTSWVTSCFGCHLPQEANWKKDSQHFEGGDTRNWTSYNPQVVRSDIFMLARHSPSKGGKIAPARSSSALLISTVNANRERLYIQQAPVSAPGYSSQAFNPHFAHTVRKTETQGCTDCHVSADDDNNAWMAQVLTLGTNFVNFMGRFVWVGMGDAGIEAVGVTEWDEPQAVIGSNLHRLAYPDEFAAHEAAGGALQEAHHHGARSATSLQLRGEYLYVANGSDGLRVYDVANIDNKGFSERIVTAPVSPLGQRAYVRTRDAASVALPTNMPVQYGRETIADPTNREQAMSPIYRYAFVADREEGLVVVDVSSLGDGEPRNNFLERAATFDADGALSGARFVTVAGNFAHVAADGGLFTIDITDPVSPRVTSVVAELSGVRSLTVQFRYAFAVDATGLRVLDVTRPAGPVLVATLPIADARDVYVARTWAYVAAGAEGMLIVDVETPTRPVVAQTFDGDGVLTDTNAIRVASTHNSAFAYVADGVNGIRVIQLVSPGETPGAQGFSPTPTPRLIASYATRGPALALSKGMDRDRAVDESGNQVSVFGRLGSRPFTRPEMERLFMRGGEVYTVSSAAPGPRLPFVRPAGAVLPSDPLPLAPEEPGAEETDQPRLRERRRLPGRG